MAFYVSISINDYACGKYNVDLERDNSDRLTGDKATFDKKYNARKANLIGVSVALFELGEIKDNKYPSYSEVLEELKKEEKTEADKKKESVKAAGEIKYSRGKRTKKPVMKWSIRLWI